MQTDRFEEADPIANQPITDSTSDAAKGEPAMHRSEAPLRALGINLVCGLRLALFRRVPLQQLRVSVDQLVWLVAIDLLLVFCGDFAAAGLPGRFNAWALPGALFYLPLMLFAAYLIARRACQPVLMLALPIALLAAGQYVSLANAALARLSGSLDFSNRAVSLGYDYGPLLWWAGIVAFTTASLTPARISVKLRALALVAVLVLAPAYLVPRTASGGLWVALEEEPADATASDASVATEEAFYAQPELLRRALHAIAPGMRGRTHLYFVGVAGDAGEDVFRKELEVIGKLMQERFGTAGRSIELINNPATVLNTPLASRTSLARTLSHIGRVMSRNDDVLFLYLTSHGSEDHRFALSFWPLRLQDLDPASLRQMLDEAAIRWRVIVVSACYAGGFIDPLKSETTLVVTAADAQHTSFGCGSESDFTYFGKAYFDQALRRHVSFTDAFEDARNIIQTRERGEGKTASNPQIYIGSAIQQKLRAFEKQLQAHQ